jgi:hypothetical protein
MLAPAVDSPLLLLLLLLLFVQGLSSPSASSKVVPSCM